MDMPILKYSLEPRSMDYNREVDNLYEKKSIKRPKCIENIEEGKSLPECCPIMDLLGYITEIENLFMGLELEDDWALNEWKDAMNGLETEEDRKTKIRTYVESLCCVWNLINKQLGNYSEEHEDIVKLNKTEFLISHYNYLFNLTEL